MNYTRENLRDLFISPFALNEWQEFLHGFFGAASIKKTPQKVAVPQTEAADGVKGFLLGEMTTSDGLRVGLFHYIVPAAQIGRRRVGLRQLVVPWIKGEYNAALVVFTALNAKSWRFSLVCDFNGEVTAPKRFTYVFGDSTAPHRTPVERFLALQASRDGTKPVSFSAMRDAFSVEALSDQFFSKYKEHYENFVSYITGKRFVKKGNKWVETEEHPPHRTLYATFKRDDKSVRDYVKMLLGRLVFLHFLQKKGWLGASDGTWADGDCAFLLHLFEKASPEQKEDFLDGVLERLFFNALNTDRSSQGDFYTTGVRGVGKCRIPYLNGGLFERDELDKLRVKFPAEMFENLLNFFAEYNFTIDENDPNEAEVGIDPEMLGRIFENLLEDNKDKGAFYTPKVIVGYMCRQSLLAYLTEGKSEKDAAAIETFLDTRDASLLPTALVDSLAQKLRDVKICDPAIGSGAFPMGLLRELFACRAALGDPNADNPAALKRSIIENNIYGVDIEKGAVDIARLRFWLSLVVDETEPSPLPNLDFKIMQGNSLVESWQGQDLSRLVERKTKVVETGDLPGLPSRPCRLTLFENATDIDRKQLRDLQHQWYSCSDHNERKRIRDAIRGAAENQVRSIWPDFSFGDLDLSANMKFFLWHLWFSEVFDQGGFDIVIGNPPYVSTKGRSDEDKMILKQVYGFADDLYYHFIIRGFELLKPRGIQSLITSDTYFTTETKKGLRDLILGNELIRLVHWGQAIFDAMVSTATFISRKAKPDSDYQSVIIDMKGRTSLADGAVYTIRQDEYRHSINRAFYVPSELNVKINERFASQHGKLIKEWWSCIKTSRDIAKNESELEYYRKNLKCGDLTLVGLVTDGGQGLATGDNGRYVGVRKGTKAAQEALLSRPEKLEEFNRKNKTTYTLPTDELAIWDLFDRIKEKYGRRAFGKGFLYRIVDDSLLVDPKMLTKQCMKSGISSEKAFVPYDKGDKEGNRWYLETPYVIDWSCKSVATLSSNPQARFQNTNFYFMEGFCYSDIKTFFIRCRMKGMSVHDVKSMSLFPIVDDKFPYYYLITLINSHLTATIVYNFLNNTPSFQINDCRMLPIIVPTVAQLRECKELFDSALAIQKKFFAGTITSDERNTRLQEVQDEVDAFVYKLFGIETTVYLNHSNTVYEVANNEALSDDDD